MFPPRSCRLRRLPTGGGDTVGDATAAAAAETVVGANDGDSDETVVKIPVRVLRVNSTMGSPDKSQ